jgi:hypothetical protein
MKKLDFSVKGMASLATYSPELINNLLLNETYSVRQAIYRAYMENPNEANKLMQHFVLMIRRLPDTDKIEFRGKWETCSSAKIFPLALKKIEKEWIKKLDWIIDEMVDNSIDNLDFETDFNNLFPHINLSSDSASNENYIIPIVKEDIRDLLFEQLRNYFDPSGNLKLMLMGERIKGKIDFNGTQNQLAGIFITLRENKEASFGTHEQTYFFIKNTFTLKGKEITSKHILILLRDPAKANRSTWINIKI